MPSSRQRALSRDIILSTALDLVDEEGLSALSRQILGVVATPFTMLTTHQNAPEAYPSLTSYAADH